MFESLTSSWDNTWAYYVFYAIFVLTILFTITVVILENRNPVKSLAWIVVLVFFPIGGFIFYLFFGQQYRHTRMISRRKRRILQRMSDAHRDSVVTTPPDLSDESLQQIELGYKLGGTRLLPHNHIELFTDGESKFDALIKELQRATEFIHLQYYIFEDDRLGNTLKTTLIEKARQGVKVRVLYDEVGCWRVKSRFFNDMRRNGIDIRPFYKVTLPQLANKFNYRNHRKVAVIDGKVGFIGGMNIADRYREGVKWGNWRDTHACIKGSAVHGLQTAFSIDWSFTTREFLSDAKYYPAIECEGDTDIQILTSGPLGEWKEIALSFHKAISNAHKCIYIQTPYFLPTDSILKALQIAALSKVDVRLMIPARGDNRILQLASQSYLKDVLLAGVKVYMYQEGFLHAKTIVIDDEFSTVGSTNFDFRSFDHNFEINAFLYSRETATRMKKIFENDMQHCRRIVLNRWVRRPITMRVVESFLRLMSPVL
ncbi:MAG: cardiolipin synthase [Coprobacter sp.]|nr:cardiolipin synthase [Coprobacter sp.]